MSGGVRFTATSALLVTGLAVALLAVKGCGASQGSSPISATPAANGPVTPTAGTEWPTVVNCSGTYQRHLQGIALDDAFHIFWSFTEVIVKTDSNGSVLLARNVEGHHGAPVFVNGALYVPVDRGDAYNPLGVHDSWIHKYDPSTLSLIATYPLPQVSYGAGAVGYGNNRFVVAANLPEGGADNTVYEYDANFNFVSSRALHSGYTLLGVQTAAFGDGAWWFGAYGNVLIRTGPDFSAPVRYNLDASLGLAPIGSDRFYVGHGNSCDAGGCIGSVTLATTAQLTAIVKQ